MDHAINRPKISSDFVELKALGLTDLCHFCPFFDDGEKEIKSFVQIAAGLMVHLAFELLK